MASAEAWAVQEAAEAGVRDERQRRTLAGVLTALLAGRGASWSVALGAGLRQAGGDLVGRSRLGLANLLAGHVSATVKRCTRHARVVLVQDTSGLNFTGLARLLALGSLGDGGGARGLWAHSLLALGPHGAPLGLLGLWLWTRPRWLPPKDERPYEQRESYKWEQGLRAASWLVPEGTEAVVVSDRESDVYEYLSAPRGDNLELVVRASWPRRSRELETATQGSVLEAGQSQAPLALVQVRVPRRGRQGARVASVVVRAVRVLVHSPKAWPAQRRSELALTVVRVDEPAAPAGVTPLNWVLLTTLAVGSAADALAVVSYYARRWRIETLHEVLKTRGVDVEKLQQRSLGALSSAIGLCFVVAWKAMELCYEAREHPGLPARERLGADELLVLAVTSGAAVETLGQAVAAIARLGGWEGYASSPAYGPKTVARGLERLATMVAYERLRRVAGGPGEM